MSRHPDDQLSILTSVITRCQGYCELKMWEQAWEELEALPGELRIAAEVYEWRMRILMGLEENEKASYIGMGIVESLPSSQDYRLLTVECLMRLGQNQEALDLLKAGPDHLWEVSIPWFYLARLQVRLGNGEEARKAVTRCSELAPEKRLEILDNPDFAELW